MLYDTEDYLWSLVIPTFSSSPAICMNAVYRTVLLRDKYCRIDAGGNFTVLLAFLYGEI